MEAGFTAARAKVRHGDGRERTVRTISNAAGGKGQEIDTGEKIPPGYP